MRDILYPLRRLHGFLFDEQQQRAALKELISKIETAPSDTILFVLTPTHGNLGDHAIAEATIALLQSKNLSFFEITTTELHLLSRYHRMRTMNGHPILVNGGGNLGTLWPNVEALFRKLIQSVPSSSIICLPNTIYYGSSSNEQKELARSRSIYNHHNNLLLCARERISYDCMRKNYNNVILVPDMALSLDKCNGTTCRHGCVLCLRSDIEKTRTEAETASIWAQAHTLFGSSVSESDMNIRRSVPVSERKRVLEEKYAEFRAAALVITDRLHGMIFAAITGTPCVVINSRSPKVIGCYEWLKDLEYIRFADDVAQITALYRSIPQKAHVYSSQDLLPFYQTLQEKILKEIVN